MNISRTDLNLFVIFEAIYTKGGVTKAAESLNLSQPTISHALGRLRAQLGDELFVRRGQRLVPTPMAEDMINPVRAALALFETTLGGLGGFDAASARQQFSIGMRALLESTYLLPLTLLLRESAPGVSLASSQFERKRLESSLASGDLHAAIDVALPFTSDIRREKLSSFPSVVVARRGHPLVDDSLDLKTYLAAEHIVVSSRPKGMGPEDIPLAEMGKSRTIALRCQEISTALRLVATSNMLLTTSESFARRAGNWIDNQVIALPFDAPSVDTFLYWHKRSEADPANRWLREMIRLAAREAEGRG